MKHNIYNWIMIKNRIINIKRIKIYKKLDKINIKIKNINNKFKNKYKKKNIN